MTCSLWPGCKSSQVSFFPVPDHQFAQFAELQVKLIRRYHWQLFNVASLVMLMFTFL